MFFIANTTLLNHERKAVLPRANERKFKYKKFYFSTGGQFFLNWSIDGAILALNME